MNVFWGSGLDSEDDVCKATDADVDLSSFVAINQKTKCQIIPDCPNLISPQNTTGELLTNVNPNERFEKVLTTHGEV